MAHGHRIVDWNPEDTLAWEAGDKAITRRNLICTVIADHVAFSIWSIWSVLVLFMSESVYGFSAGDKLLLGAVATLVGGCVRIPYTLGIAKFGGRTWTVFRRWCWSSPPRERSCCWPTRDCRCGCIWCVRR
jgi:NNP family nitrate/nitrite transporter-like MFS transporter